MTITLRDILRQFADTGNLDSEYVSLAEYEAMQIDLQWVQTQLIIDGHDPDCACVTASSVDCSCGQREKVLHELELLKSGFGVSPIEKPLIDFVELKTKNKTLLAILKRWDEISEELHDSKHWDSYQGQSIELTQLIADTTEAVKGE